MDIVVELFRDRAGNVVRDQSPVTSAKDWVDFTVSFVTGKVSWQ